MSTSHVRYSIETSLSAEAVVQDLHVREALGEPYAAVVIIEVEQADQSAEELLGQDVLVRWERESSERRLAGVVRAVATLDPEGPTHSRFRLEVVPALWMLSLRRDTRMFQQMSVPDILEKVLSDGLGPYARSVDLQLSAEYPTREYCLQYQEADLDFVHRLMEEEGITYAFDHQGDVEVMSLRDANAAHPRAAGASEPIQYVADSGRAIDQESIHGFVLRHDHTTTSVSLRDFDWTKGGHVVEAQVEGEDARGKVRESYEHGWGCSVTISDYDEGARRYQEEDSVRQADLRLEGYRASEVVATGAGRVVSFAPGTTFEIAGHPIPGTDGEYLITSVTHRAHASSEGPAAEPYHNVFECIPAAVPHRPRRATPKPRIASVQTAVVTGPAGEEIHVDEHGRIKVQFHWDRENPADDTSSCWIRVQQKWAGAGWGFWWAPRIGMEVVVQFIDGDPDRPLVTGSVYNGDNLTPYALPDEKTKSTIKSNSTPGGGGSNELRFEDRASNEEIFVHAQKDYNEVVENDHNTLVHHDQDNTVDNDQTQTVHAHQLEEVGANQALTVDGNRTVHVESNFDETVDGTETRTVTGDVTETFDANEARTVAADLTEDIAADETRTLGGSQTETISGNHTMDIGAGSDRTVGGSLTETVTGAVASTIGADWEITPAAGMTMLVPGGLTITAGGSWNVAAPGGVEQVDSFHEWFGGKKDSKGATFIGVCGIKFETYGQQVSLTIQKVGLTGAAMPNLGTSIEFHMTKDRKVGVKMSMMGAEVEGYGADVKN